MILHLKKLLTPKNWLFFLSILFIISFMLPSYDLDYIINLTSIGNNENFGNIPRIMYGIDCFWQSTLNMADSPVAFLGSLANFTIILIWILFLSGIEANLKILKNILTVITMVSVLIWLVSLKIGFLPGYFLWAISAIGITLSFNSFNNIAIVFDETILDDNLKQDIEQKL